MAEEKRTWTSEQEAAITAEDKTLLVSAAAGSGKTATLTERIIRSIIDEKRSLSIKDMLIVTFTNSAVGELRDRISAAIKKAAAERPGDFRLEEELLTVRDAKIMTIDAFCNSILKSCASSVGLPPNYRIGDDAELALLSGSIMDGLINCCYEGEIPEISTAKEFAYLAECLTTARGEGTLSDVFLDLYEKTESTVSGIDTLSPLIEIYNPEKFTSVDETIFGKYILDEVRRAFTSYKKAYRLIDLMEGRDGRDGKAYAKLLPDKIGIDNVLSANSFSAVRELIMTFELASMQGLRGEKSDEYLRLECIRNIMKTDLAHFKDDYFAYSEEEWKTLYSGLYSTLGVLLRFLKKFDELFCAEKKRRGLCSYGDIEKYAYYALWQNGEKTDYAKELASSFKAIYIDEYQDVNNLQNKIFEAVSTDTNRFMVGDIKQSIYGFRSAKPEIFADMKKRFPKFENSENSPAASLFMSSNFRCDKEIVDFTNGIFNKIFTALGKNIGYEPSDALVFHKLYKTGEEPRNNIPEVHLIEKYGKSAQEYAEKSDDAITDMVLEEDEFAVSFAAGEVAKRIEELLKGGIKANGNPYKPSDIAIILRSAKGRAESYREALEKRGIKASIADSGEFLKSEEILLTLALLNTVDNPRRDIYLAALLMSPLFGFTPDELVLIRKCSDSETLYEALLQYCALHVDFSKGHRFLSSLEKYRALAEGISIDSLLSLLFRETGLLSLAEKNGGKDNLMLLQSYAKNYEKSSFKGLYSFISYINNIINENKKFDAGASSVEDSDTVKIITAHKSKGLEFPACFFAESDIAIRKNATERIAYAEDFGLSLLLKDPSGISLVSNPVQNVINKYNSEKEYEEELRILYVILTRAREYLFVYGTASTVKYQEKLDAIKILGEETDEYLATKFKSMFEIVEALRDCGTFFFHELPKETISADTADNGIDDATIGNFPAKDEDAIRKDATELIKRFNFVYPDKLCEKLPEKLSVSRLYPEILDGNELSEVTLAELLSERRASVIPEEPTLSDDFKPYLPKFISGIEADESAKRGIATHTFMQFCDFELLAQNGAKAELERLIKNQYLSADDGARVRINEIESFIASPLFTEMKNAKKIHRELRFNVKFPAEMFTADEELKIAVKNEKLLVQGVIDCIIVNPDGTLHLVDYKTDRLTKEEREDRTLGRNRLRKNHSLQLSYYKCAVEALFGKAPSKIGVYSLHLGEEVAIEN